MLRRVTVFRGKRDTDVEHEQEKSNRESDVMHFFVRKFPCGSRQSLVATTRFGNAYRAHFVP